jgi:hypothetical protein
MAARVSSLTERCTHTASARFCFAGQVRPPVVRHLSPPPSSLSRLFSHHECPVNYKISNLRIDMAWGFCQGNLDSVDARKVTDLRYTRSFLQSLSGRGTVHIQCADQTTPHVREVLA